MIRLMQLPMNRKASGRPTEIPIHDASQERKVASECWSGSRTNVKGSDRGSKDPGTPTEDRRIGEGEEHTGDLLQDRKKIELGYWLGTIDIDSDGWRTASKGRPKSTNTTSKSFKTPSKKPVSTSKGCLHLSKRKEPRGQHLCRMQVIMRYARHCLPPSIRLDKRGVAPIRRCKHTLSRNQEQRSSIFSSWRTK